MALIPICTVIGHGCCNKFITLPTLLRPSFGYPASSVPFSSEVLQWQLVLLTVLSPLAFSASPLLSDL